MKYKNASDVLPESLLKEVQKYAAGETLYFPKDRERKKWGEVTGARSYFQERNTEIRQKYLGKRLSNTLRMNTVCRWRRSEK
ncbi:CD3324 family protein [Paenibacillus sp. D2_2]|uniref:CD3324 family protein n=1 Tax=Paenibacillus sp. D2_2 TaxID=3073092 RepID=UPI0028160A9F|nr:CD3324 family protein [Paenibacillus sp. D2_2]WMT39403.1 CD3324 family protein [Paenibacillus sp. D2_2]